MTDTPDYLTFMSGAELHEAFEALRRSARLGGTTNARRVLVLVIGYLCPETGRILLTREQMARLLGISAEAVSDAISALASIGAMRRERIAARPARGGPGARYFLNPHLAWSGSHEARARAIDSFEPPQPRRYRDRR